MPTEEVLGVAVGTEGRSSSANPQAEVSASTPRGELPGLVGGMVVAASTGRGEERSPPQQASPPLENHPQFGPPGTVATPQQQQQQQQAVPMMMQHPFQGSFLPGAVL